MKAFLSSVGLPPSGKTSYGSMRASTLAPTRHQEQREGDAVEETAVAKLRDHIHFRSSLWLPIPDWSRFFIDLGAAVARRHEESPRLVAAVVVPTRAFAAGLSAAGV